MTDVLQIARERRAKLMSEIEARMAEIERIDDFVAFGHSLAGTTANPAATPRTERFAAE